MRRKYLMIFVGTMLLLFACKKDQVVSVDESNTLFVEKKAADSGIDFSNNLSAKVELNILEYLYYYNGGGVAIGDINNDGLEDVLLTSNESVDQLFLNKGGLTFEDITEKSGLQAVRDWSTGAVMDDINNDGYLDIYICKVDPIAATESYNLLYLNNGNGTFTESAEKYGLDFSGYSTQASFFDYDQDGDLDMYLLNHSVHSVSSYGKVAKRLAKDPLSGDRFYENKINESEGKFVDVTEQAGILSSALGYGLGIITTDLNNDGWTDIYVGNDFHENDYIYINNGNKTFRESMSSLLNHCSKFTMGVDVADMNGDGQVDIFTTDMLPYDKEVALKSGGEDTDQIFKIRKEFGFEDQYARNHFHLQLPDHHFSDIALMTNTYATDWSWSVLLQDFDNNGLNDIFITNGIVKRPNDLDYIKFLSDQGNALNKKLNQKELDLIWANMPAQKLENVLFLQESDLTFSDLSHSKIGSPTFSNGSAYADLDQDGDLDLVTNNINAPASILENTSASSNNYIAFQLKNSNLKKTSKGAIVEVHYKGEIMKRVYTTTRGYQSSSSHQIHFGLGKKKAIDSVVIIWPDGTQQVVKGLAINQLHLIEKEEKVKPYSFPVLATANKNLDVLAIKHIENDFADYNADKLIPKLLSKEGPAVVYEDFNQDGQADLFIGGARNQAPRMFFYENGGFVEDQNNIDFKKDVSHEDVDAAAIDFDKDGDLDLYVVSGGNDGKELDKQLQDRLYLNDGKGNLKRLPLSLPHTNGSSVSVGDFDQDGYDDLFIGARSIPGSYGLSPYSFVLKNQKGFGVKLIKKERYGMITDSQWADIDNDQDLDLVMCGDWMNIAVLENQGDGNLVYKSNDLGFENSMGLWNNIYLHDLNQDGQLDIIAGNAGTNLKWKASPEKPLKMYVLDMDKNGYTEPIMFYHAFGNYLPFSSLDKLITQVPSVRKQFVRYRDYTKVNDILDFDQIKQEDIVENKNIKELRSMIYLSKNGKYEGVPLPVVAQRSSIQDFVVKENNDLFYIGNDDTYLAELGKNQSSSGGQLLKFDIEFSTFKEHKTIPLPHKLSTRSILPLGKNKYLITCNNSVQYILNDK